MRNRSAPDRRRSRTARRFPAFPTLAATALIAATMAFGSRVDAAIGPTGQPVQAAPTTPLKLTFQPDTVAADGQFPVIVAVDDAPPGSSLLADIYDRVENANLEDSTDRGPQDRFNRVPLADTPGRQQSGFTISLYHRGLPRPATPWAYRLDEPGVYPVRVRLLSRGGTTLASLVTFLVRLPEDDQHVPQRQVALLATINQAPPADDTARAGLGLADPGLIQRLGPVLDAFEDRPTLPAAFAVTPDTLTRLAHGDDQEGAAAVGRLREVVSGTGREVLDAPYVDIDPASLVRAGLTEEISRQRDLGRATLAEVLQPPTTGTWSLARPVTTEALASLRARGVFRILLPRAAFMGQLPPTALTLPAGDGQVQALSVDPVFAVGVTSGDPVLAGHRFLARVAALGGTTMATSPAVIGSLGTGPLDMTTLAIILDGLTNGSTFYRSTTVSDLFGRASADQTAALAPAPPVPLGSYPDLEREVHASVRSYGSMVVDRPELAARFDRPMAVSASAELALEERIADLHAVEASVQRRFAAISTTERDKVTLGARIGRFPLPIRSRLGYPVRVRIDLSANDRLVVSSRPIFTTLTGSRTVTPIRVRARASGDAPLRVTVRTPDGRVVLAESRYTVRSTAVSGVGVALTVGAAAFLGLWWGRHWWRHRARHAG